MHECGICTHSQRMCVILLHTLKDQVINLLGVGSSQLKGLYEPINISMSLIFYEMVKEVKKK